MVAATDVTNVPLLVAHRGYARRFPENTLEAIEAALIAGACLVEFDVQLTSDGVPVLLHDVDLERTAGRMGRVMELSTEQLQAFDVGQPGVFGNRFTGVRVPTLASAIELLQGWPRVRAFVEVKPEGIEHFGVERVVEQVLAELGGKDSRHILISSISDFVEEARRAGHPQIGLVLRNWSEKDRLEVEELQPDYVFCNLERIPEATELWAGPWKWVVYEITSPALALELAERGAAFIETMEIGEMLADPVLGKEGCRD